MQRVITIALFVISFHFWSFGQQDTAQADQYYKQASALWQEELDYESSLEYYAKAKDIYEKIFGETSRKVARCYRQMGNNYRDMRRYQKSEQFLTKAVDILDQLDQNDDIFYGQTIGDLASTFSYMGNYEKAVIYYGKTSEIFERDLAEDDERLAILYYNIGNAHLGKEKSQLALAYFFKALKIDEIFGDGRYIASDYDNIASAYQQLGEYDKAISYFNQSIDLYVESVGAEDEETSHALKLRGECLLEMGRYDESLEDLKKAYSISSNILGNDNPEVGDIQSIIGAVYAKKGEYTAAEQAFEKALASLNYTGNESLDLQQIASLGTLLRILERKGSYLEMKCGQEANVDCLQPAVQTYLDAVALTDTIRQGYQEKGAKLDLAQTFKTIIESGIRTLYRTYEQSGDAAHLKQLFRLFEKDKSLLLLESFVESRAVNFAGIPNEYLEEIAKLEADMAFLEQERFYEQQLGPEADAAYISQIDGQLFDNKQAFNLLKEKMVRQYPEYFNLLYNIDVIGLDQVQSELLSANEALVSYFIGEQLALAIIVTKEQASIVKLDNADQYTAQITALRDGLYGYFLASSANQTQELYDQYLSRYQDAANALYNSLIKPLNTSLLPEEWIVIPDGVLGYIPFDVLLSEKVDGGTAFRNYPYLAKAYRISYTYSATLLQEFQQKKQSKAKETLLAFAPQFKGETTDVAGILARRRDLGNLKFNVPEVEAIAEIFESTLMLRDEATEARFREMAGDYRILHLSTHGKANDKVGDYSYLAFSPIEDSLENELLYVRDLYGLSLNADMVVLSACETGIGELKEGEGIVSLANGFAFAGAKSIITTLWSVNDAQTKEIMLRFYENLGKGMDKDAALYEAKLTYMEEMPNAKAHPFYWAGYIPLGDMSPVNRGGISNFVLGVIISIALLLIISIFVMRNKNRSTRS